MCVCERAPHDRHKATTCVFVCLTAEPATARHPRFLHPPYRGPLPSAPLCSHSPCLPSHILHTSSHLLLGYLLGRTSSRATGVNGRPAVAPPSQPHVLDGGTRQTAACGSAGRVGDVLKPRCCGGG